MKKIIPLKTDFNPIKPTCAWSLIDFATIKTSCFDRKTVTFKEKFDRPKSLEEAFGWIKELDIDEDFAFSKSYEVPHTIKLLLRANENASKQKVTFQPECSKVYSEFNGVDLKQQNRLTVSLVVDRAIPLQEFQKELHLALEYGIVFSNTDVVVDLLHQLETLDTLDTHYEQIVNFFKKRIESFDYTTISVNSNPWLLSRDKLFMHFVKKASDLIENDVNQFQDNEVGLLTIGCLKEQSDFDEFINSMSHFTVQRLQDKLVKLLDLPMVENSMLLHRLTSNPSTFEVVKEVVKDLITYEADGKDRVSQWRNKVNSDFKRWMIKNGFIQASL